MMAIRGTYPALVTPFRDGALDESALRSLVGRMIDGGVSGLVPCGTTGESVTLSDDEHRRVVEIVVEEARGRVPVFAGAGTVSTAHTIHLARRARDVGADGLLIVCPYYNRPSQAGLEAHFRAVAKAVPLPTMVYNVPHRTGVDLAVETLGRLADVEAIVAIKEATGNVLRSQEIVSQFGDRFAVMSGDDGLTLPILAIGGVGVVSVTANAFPKEVCDVTRLFAEGKLDEARALHLRLVPVHQSMFIDSSPGPLKAVLAAAGHLAKEVRLPLVWPSDATIARVHEILGKAELRA